MSYKRYEFEEFRSEGLGYYVVDNRFEISLTKSMYNILAEYLQSLNICW